MTTLQITLPWPPSANSYWRHPNKGANRGRSLISEKGRAYRKTVAWEVVRQKARCRLLGRIGLQITAHVPDRRRRDLDNLLKATQDALAHAGVYADDSQIDLLLVQRAPVSPPGRLDIEITELAD